MRLSVFRLTVLACVCYSTPIFASVAATSAAAQRLSVRLDALLTSPATQQSNVVRTAELLASPAQIAAVCDNPELSLAGNDSRLTGKRTAVAQCGKRKHYLPIRISAEGTWWVASQNLTSGTVIQRGDVQPITGDLAGQPAGLMFTAAEIVGQRLTRSLSAGKPLLKSQLRQQYQLHAGQTVDVVTLGAGFRIRSQGKALSNAAVDGTLNVQTRNGQIVQGKVAADGLVMIYLR